MRNSPEQISKYVAEELVWIKLQNKNVWYCKIDSIFNLNGIELNMYTV